VRAASARCSDTAARSVPRARARRQLPRRRRHEPAAVEPGEGVHARGGARVGQRGRAGLGDADGAVAGHELEAEVAAVAGDEVAADPAGLHHGGDARQFALEERRRFAALLGGEGEVGDDEDGGDGGREDAQDREGQPRPEAHGTV
jgi:hypothetical protein